MNSGTDRIPLKRALVSVYDKTGLEDLVRGLHDAGVALVSTGGSATLIESLGLPVTKVEDLTGFPECLDGRVKTLHPKVHAGILADRRLDTHVQQLAELGVEPFDLVVSNLYPFTETVMSGASPDECVEQIDIGGPSMVRAAAKNHPSVAIVTSPERYPDILRAAGAGGFSPYRSVAFLFHVAPIQAGNPSPPELSLSTLPIQEATWTSYVAVWTKASAASAWRSASVNPPAPAARRMSG